MRGLVLESTHERAIVLLYLAADTDSVFKLPTVSWDLTALSV